MSLFLKNNSLFINNNILSYLAYRNLFYALNNSTNSNMYNLSIKNSFYRRNNIPKLKNNINDKSQYFSWYKRNKNKIIITSSFFGISLIIFDIKNYLKKKKIENKIRKNIMEFINDENPTLIYISDIISYNYATKFIKILVNNYIKNIISKYPSIDNINIHFKKDLKNNIIKYITNDKGQKFFFELIKNYLINISTKEIKSLDLYENFSNKQDILIDEFLENSLIKTLSTKNFNDYIINNVVNEIEKEINKNKQINKLNNILKH